MPRKKTEPADILKAVSPLNVPDSFRLNEMGGSGFPVFAGVPQEELRRELNFPQSIQTFKEMQLHSAVAASLKLPELLISKADYKLKPPENATKKELKQTELVKEMLDDMQDCSFDEFLVSVSSALAYGFCITEKVFYRRNKKSGSKYNDNLIGIKKLAYRNQTTIQRFLFSDDGNDLTGCVQNLSGHSDFFSRLANKGNEIKLPRSKFMLFRTGQHNGNPVGKSPLINAYTAWRFLVELEKIEAQGVAKDLNGVPMLSIPAQYMAADATPAQKTIYEYYMRVLNNMQAGVQSGIIIPSATDPETRQPLFKLELLSADGKKNFNTTDIKKYYRDAIHIALFADLLILGTSNTGSYNLATTKQTLMGAFVEQFLTMVRNVVNKELIEQIYDLNGWDRSRACKLDFDSAADVSLEELSKYVQRISSVSMLPRDLATINVLRQAIGVDSLTEYDDWEEMMPDFTSRSGDGMAKGSGNGTSDEVSGTDNSSTNLDNNA